jgi:glycosyltransferase involved in cell wall biosynthesis
MMAWLKIWHFWFNGFCFMNIVFFTHPAFFYSQSMPLFTRFLLEGMKSRGHEVEIWTAAPRLSNLWKYRKVRKWLGYFDQYILFPYQVKKRIENVAVDTLFVFTDQALGAWVPLVANKPHVIHCHDFLAQYSAIRRVNENPVSWTGRKYQLYIRNGYMAGENFISVSKKTESDLHYFLGKKPKVSEVVYNGMNKNFTCSCSNETRILLGKEFKIDLSKGYLLHIGGNQWYKNRIGVIEIYNAWRSIAVNSLPLLLVGELPSAHLLEKRNQSEYRDDIYFLSAIKDEWIVKFYARASLFIFPSLAEGFGWPIAEAMAAGCPVITTNEAPMTEVGDAAAYYINRMPFEKNKIAAWAKECAGIVNTVLNLPDLEKEKLIKTGLVNAKRFDTSEALENIDKIYKKVLENSQ